MKIFDYMEKYGHEQIIFCYDGTSGLKAIIGIPRHHIRTRPRVAAPGYKDYETEEEALIDVLDCPEG